MGKSLEMTLTNSRGLGKVVFFSGLRFPMVMTPGLLGEPILTAQAYYFAAQLDSVVRMHFESDGNKPSEREIEYVIDNYLFEYSKKHPDSKLTSKITESLYWQWDSDDAYFQYDWRNLECLALDALNDPSVLECKDPFNDEVFDWCRFKPYWQEAYDAYRKNLNVATRIEVFVRTKDHPTLGTGTHHLPIVKFVSHPLTLEQVEMLGSANFRELNPDSPTYHVSRGLESEFNFEFPQEIITVTSYHDSQLLAYYFSAVRDNSPVSEFKNYYNVLEYFFEEAPARLGVVAQVERQQVEAVLRWAVSTSDLLEKVKALPAGVIAEITKPRRTSSGEVMAGLNLNAPDFIKEYAGRVYQLRNACIHSKKTRRGVATSRIVPSMDEEKILSDEIPLMQWLAVKCIEKDSSTSP